MNKREARDSDFWRNSTVSMMGILSDQVSVVASAMSAILAAAQDKAIVSADDCRHQLAIGWKPGKAICALCRQPVENPDNVGIRITRLPEMPDENELEES